MAAYPSRLQLDESKHAAEDEPAMTRATRPSHPISAPLVAVSKAVRRSRSKDDKPSQKATDQRYSPLLSRLACPVVALVSHKTRPLTFRTWAR